MKFEHWLVGLLFGSSVFCVGMMLQDEPKLSFEQQAACAKLDASIKTLELEMFKMQTNFQRCQELIPVWDRDFAAKKQVMDARQKEWTDLLKKLEIKGYTLDPVKLTYTKIEAEKKE